MVLCKSEMLTHGGLKLREGSSWSFGNGSLTWVASQADLRVGKITYFRGRLVVEMLLIDFDKLNSGKDAWKEVSHVFTIICVNELEIIG